MSSLQENIKQLIASQTASWETARENYAALKNIRTRRIEMEGFSFAVQFNPQRIRSTAAPEGPVERPCFLCAANRPAEQKAVPWENYQILVNPYPIFDPHLTIPAVRHIPQFLTGKWDDMIRLSSLLPDFAITFNGARCGASAPDHFHFQAVEQGVLPATKELPDWKKRSLLYDSEKISVWGADEYLRPAIVIEGKTIGKTAQTAETILSGLKPILGEPDEAQVNALAWRNGETYFAVLFPRTAHRPQQFYAKDDTQFLFSPGAIDLAGVLITVREQDYERATAALIHDLFIQVVPNITQWKQIKAGIRLCLARNRK